MDFSDEELQQIFKIFKEESEEHLGNINKCLLELEKRPDDIAIISELFREAHSIKGSARMLDITSIQTLAHKIEDLLGLAKDGTIQISSNIIDILCQGVDTISRNVEKLEYNNLSQADENSDKLAQEIESLKESLLAKEEKKPAENNKKEQEITKTDKDISKINKTTQIAGEQSGLNIILHYIEQIDNKFQKNNAIDEILTVLQDLLSQKLSDKETEILKLTQNNLNYIKENDITPPKEVIQAIEQAIQSVFVKNPDEDLNLIIQRLNILKQMLELSKENEKLLNVPETKTSYDINNTTSQKKNKNYNSIPNYETGIFKTLRVDTQKLDKLENQVEELIVLKIKNKQHIKTIDMVMSEISEIQKKLSKAFSGTKYNEKKSAQSSLSVLDNATNLKNIKNHIDKINEKTHDLYEILDKFQKNFLNDDARLNFLTDEIENMVKSIRILPLATIFHMFPRMVRDIARTQNKQVDIIITGSETSADKTIIEEIKSPLIHIIRNAIDHGIETPEERIKAGKNPTGKILLNSYHSDNAITIEVIDDGKGIDTQEIKEKVLAQNLISQEELNQLTELQVMNLIFWPGFTTGEDVTEISGRGVGLDVVHTKIAQLDGKVSIQSQQGTGFKIKIKIPITLATLKVLLIKVQNQIFAISSSFVKTVTIITNEELLSKEGKDHILYNDTSVRLVKLSELLNLKQIENSNPKKHNVVVIQVEDTTLALEVDEFVRTEEILQKKLNPPLSRVKNISGVSSLSSGESCFVLNLNDIIKSSLSVKELQRKQTILSMPTKEAKIPNILIIDDSYTILALEKNILKSAGFNVIQATNGVEGCQQLLHEKIDIIITDIEMPEMNGIEFIKRVRTRDTNIPIIVLTSKYDNETKSACQELGITDFIYKKDFSESMLLNKIKKYL